MAAENRQNRQEDHDLLVQLNTLVQDLSKQFTNHLHHHLLYTLALLAAFLSVVGAFIVQIVSRLSH